VWRVDYEKPVRTGNKQGEMQLNCFFLRCLSVGQDWHSPGHRKGKCRTAASPKLFTFREAGMQIVTPLPENHCSILFTTGYKKLTEGGLGGEGRCGCLLWAFALGLFAWLLGFWLSEMGGFGREKDCQRGKMNC
jgi:hypothetical protein